MTKTIDFKLDFTNESNYYVVLADGKNIIFAGTEKEANEELDNQSKYITTKYNDLRVVAPKETTSSNYIKHIWDDEDQDRDLLGELMQG